MVKQGDSPIVFVSSNEDRDIPYPTTMYVDDSGQHFRHYVEPDEEDGWNLVTWFKPLVGVQELSEVSDDTLKFLKNSNILLKETRVGPVVMQLVRPGPALGSVHSPVFPVSDGSLTIGLVTFRLQATSRHSPLPHASLQVKKDGGIINVSWVSTSVLGTGI